MPGDLSLAMSREPSLLRACAHVGPTKNVLTAVDEDGPLALCTYAPWRYWVGGKPTTVYTVGDFRALARGAGRSITGQGWKALRERLEGSPAIVSLLDDNPMSHRLFSKQRKGWPTLKPVARLRTSILVLFPGVGEGAVGFVTPSTSQILESLSRQHLEPLLEAESMGVVTPAPESFLAEFDGHRVRASGALWDTSLFRQVKVAGYSGLYARLRSLAHRLRLPLLPAPGASVSLQYVAFLRGETLASKRRVLSALMRRAERAGCRFLVLGEDAGTPRVAPGYWPHFRMNSTLYQLCWGDAPTLGFAPTGFEVAWL